METYVILFKSPTCADWFAREIFPISVSVDAELRALRARYPQYKWSV